jgi:hypothetical protein
VWQGPRFMVRLAQQNYTLSRIGCVHMLGRKHPVLLRFTSERDGGARAHCLDFLMAVNTPENVRVAWRKPRGSRAPRTAAFRRLHVASPRRSLGHWQSLAKCPSAAMHEQH